MKSRSVPFIGRVTWLTIRHGSAVFPPHAGPCSGRSPTRSGRRQPAHGIGDRATRSYLAAMLSTFDFCLPTRATTGCHRSVASQAAEEIHEVLLLLLRKVD